MSQKEIAENFVKGCGEFIYAAVIIGLARGSSSLQRTG